MTLAADVDAFCQEHRKCGDLENRSPADGARVVLVCSCGAILNRPNVPDDPLTMSNRVSNREDR